MRILIDIGHPAHVHYFRNFYQEMTKNGHQFLITARKKEVSHDLLIAYNIPFIDRGKGSQSMIGKLAYLPKGDAILFREAKKFNPDLFMSFSSPYAAQVSSILRKPHIAFDDTEHARLGRLLYSPFTDVVLSPSSYKGKRSTKQVFFNGYLELCYLHPNRFKPSATIRDELNLEKEERFVLLRFVSWQATHDTGHSGISLENKRRVVREFSKYSKVFISSEEELPDDLKPHRLAISPEQIHDVINEAGLVFGESATMASEAAVLGTPAIYLDDDGRGYTDDLEKSYGLVFNYTESLQDQERAIRKGTEILSDTGINKKFEERRQKMLSEKIDVTQFLIDFVEEYMEGREK